MYCPNCNQEYDGKFCPECGTKLIEKSVTPNIGGSGVNINLGDANAISGGVHVVNNTTYVQEREKSATEIEQEHRIQFMNLCEEVFEDGIIDEHEIVKLETERLRLGLDETTAKRIIETSRNASQTLKRELSPRDAVYLKTALQSINCNQIERLKTLLPKLEVMNELYKVEEVSYVYNLLTAALYPEKLIKAYEEQVVDSYWQTYWVFVAYLKKAEIVKAEKALSRLNLYTKYPESNGYLLSALSSSFELDAAVAQDLLSVIPSSLCSPELKNYYESLIYEFAPQTAGEEGIQCHEILFYVENIIHLDNPYQKAEIKERTQRAIENEKEKEEIEIIYQKGKRCYNQGELSEAIKWFLIAAEQGNAKAQNDLGFCYDKGEGVSQNYEEAARWYRKAAEQGQVYAQYNLALAYENGEGVSQNYEEAARWYRKAAEQGHADAQFNLGNSYCNGKGVSQNYEEAAMWYRKAAEQGDADAQCGLGYCYYVGQGVSKDYTEAVKWWRMAAEQGDDYAQSNLGECYYFGRGVPQNNQKAKEWWQKAAEQGNQDAIDCLNGKTPEDDAEEK